MKYAYVYCNKTGLSLNAVDVFNTRHFELSTKKRETDLNGKICCTIGYEEEDVIHVLNFNTYEHCRTKSVTDSDLYIKGNTNFFKLEESSKHWTRQLKALILKRVIVAVHPFSKEDAPDKTMRIIRADSSVVCKLLNGVQSILIDVLPGVIGEKKIKLSTLLKEADERDYLHRHMQHIETDKKTGKKQLVIRCHDCPSYGYYDPKYEDTEEWYDEWWSHFVTIDLETNTVVSGWKGEDYIGYKVIRNRTKKKVR